MVDLTVFRNQAFTDESFDSGAFEVESVSTFESFGSLSVVLRQETPSPASADETDQFAFVTGPLQSQCVRAMKRFLQDEQSSALAALRTARGRVALEDLVGDEVAHLQRLGSTAETFLIDAYRVGADAANRTVEGASAGQEAEEVSDLSDLSSAISATVAASIRGAIQSAIDTEPDSRSLGESIAGSYRLWSSDRLAELLSAQLHAAFTRGFNG
jgi:hypothetical protein